jgi:toxin ParE1/3/4
VKRRVVWAAEARTDYLAAIRYIAERNPDAALGVAQRIEDAGASLGEFPIGRRGRVKGTYEKVISGQPYMIAYEIVAHPEGGETIAILHVIHTARHWPEGGWPKGRT